MSAPRFLAINALALWCALAFSPAASAATGRTPGAYAVSPNGAATYSVAGRSTVFGRELQQFLNAGYTRAGDYLVPPAP